MNEMVEIKLRNIIYQNSSPLEVKEDEGVDLTGMTLEEVMELEREKEFRPEIRVFDEKLFDQMVVELYDLFKK